MGGITNIGVLPGSTGSSTAAAINDAGVVVGTTTKSPYDHAYKFSNGVMTDLGTLGADSHAYGINNSGTIVGTSTDANIGILGFKYTSATGMISIGTVPGGFRSEAFAIDDAGVIVGRYGLNSNIFGFKYRGTALEDIPFSNGMRANDATAISRNGNIVGMAAGAGIGYGPYVSNGTTTQVYIGAQYNFMTTAGINDSATYVGTWGASGPNQAFRGVGANIGLLPIPNNLEESHAYGINNAGVTVGNYTLSPTSQHAALWKADQTYVDLDTWLDQVNPIEGAKWTIFQATAINNNNLVVGNGLYNDGPGGASDGFRAFILDVSGVPEPTSGGMILTAAAATATGRRKTRKKGHH